MNCRLLYVDSSYQQQMNEEEDFSLGKCCMDQLFSFIGIDFLNEESEAFVRAHPLNVFDFDRNFREDWVDRVAYEKVPFKNHILSGGVEISPSTYFALKTPTDAELHAKLDSIAHKPLLMNGQLGTASGGSDESLHKSQPFTYPAVSSQEKEIASNQINQFGVIPVKLDTADPSVAAQNERMPQFSMNPVSVENQPGHLPSSSPSRIPLPAPSSNGENPVLLPSPEMDANHLFQQANEDMADMTILPEMNLIGPSVLSDNQGVSTLSTMTGKGQLDIDDLNHNIPSLANPSVLLNLPGETKAGYANQEDDRVEQEVDGHPSMFLQPSLFEPARPPSIDQIPPVPKPGKL